MMKNRTSSCVRMIAYAALALLPARQFAHHLNSPYQQPPPRQSGGQAAAPNQTPQFRVLRSETGAAGVPHDNDFTVTDPRTVFHIPADKQVIVFFEWEGPTGPHHFVGTWRSPDGKAFSVSDFQYPAAETHFRGYWILTLSENMPSGLWVLEAQIDGVSAGTQAFQIVAPEPPPTTAAIYQRAITACVFIDSLDAQNQTIRQGSGFFFAPSEVLTAFQVIDGASSLRLTLSNGVVVTATQLVGWNRFQDWAVVKVDVPAPGTVEIEKPDAYKVGEGVYVLDVPQSDNRTIQNAQISGLENGPSGAKRMSVNWWGTLRTVGSPVFNLQGKVIGLMGGGFVPGEANVRHAMRVVVFGGRAVQSDPLLVTPVALPLAGEGGGPATLADLAKAGILIPAIASPSLVSDATLSRNSQMTPDRSMILPIDPTREFSKKQASLALVVRWMAPKNMKTMEEIHIYDANGHEVAQIRPRPLSIGSNKIISTDWKTSVATLPVGDYRLDVIAAGAVQWRDFFRVTE